MTLRVRQTYQISEIILMIAKIMKPLPPDLRDTLVRKIVDEGRLIISQANADLPQHKIEVMNLLIVLRTFGPAYIFDIEMLSRTFEFYIASDNSISINGRLDYFQLVFLISYVGGVKGYESLVEATVTNASLRFLNSNWFEEAENVFVFFDLLSCPYVSNSAKIQIAKLVLRHNSEKDLNDRATNLLLTISNRTWFFGWTQTVDLASVLKKKELRTPY